MTPAGPHPTGAVRCCATPAVASLVLLAGCAPGTDLPRAPAGAPNVLLVTIDTLRADRLGPYGYGRPTTPALDAFAREAVVFDEAVASSAWTLPTLASTFTGEQPTTHGCTNYGSILDDSFTTLAERLLAAGYDTTCVVSHLFATSRHGLQQGFVHTDDSYAHPEVDRAAAITSQVISDQGIRYLDQKEASPDEGVPWLLWLHYFDPHEEYMTHPGISEAFVTPGERTPGQAFGDVYDGEIRYTDQHLGRVLAALDRLGLAGSTVVVVVADHGEEFFEHGARGHGHSLHREIVRVPLLIRAPGLEPRRVSATVGQVDVLPTVLDLVGLPVPGDLPGRSLTPLMRSAGGSPVPVLLELDNDAYHMKGLATERYTLVRDGAGNRTLWDREDDPAESENVAARHPEVVSELEQELDRRLAAAAARAALFGRAPDMTFTPAQREDLEALGYGGSDEEDEDQP